MMSVTSHSLYTHCNSPPAAAVRAPCGHLASAVVFVKNLRPRRVTLRRPYVIISRTYGSRRFSVSTNLKIRRAATVTYVTATVSGRGNSAATVELLLAVEILESTAAVANVTEV